MAAYPLNAALRVPRQRLVLAILYVKRCEHRELAIAPSLAQLEAIVEREEITVQYSARLPASVLGQSMRFLGNDFVLIAAAAPPEVRRRTLAHELAHVWMHCCDPTLMAWRAAEVGCCFSNPGPWPIHDRTEDEADMGQRRSSGSRLRRTGSRCRPGAMRTAWQLDPTRAVLRPEDPDCGRCSVVETETSAGQWLNLAGGQGFHGDRGVRGDRIGKKRAGRMLDARTWDEFPASEATGSAPRRSGARWCRRCCFKHSVLRSTPPGPHRMPTLGAVCSRNESGSSGDLSERGRTRPSDPKRSARPLAVEDRPHGIPSVQPGERG